MVKTALLIGVSKYADGLSPLPRAVDDIKAMKGVLEQPDLGDFNDIKVLPNPNPFEMQFEIEQLFSNRKKDDLIVLFFSGHGIKDDSGNLYFATNITQKTPGGELIKATAVPSRFIHDIMSNSRSRRQVVILDCCFSGAFAKGLAAKDDGTVAIKDQLGGEGRVVLTSSTATQYSFEESGTELSVYTRYLVEGIASGAADTDNDGMISVEELHEYAKRKVHESVPAMKPKIYAVEEGFKILLTQSPVHDPALIYRKEVEQCSIQGKISSIGRRILDELRVNLALSDAKATEIEAAVTKPYREYQKKLTTYRQVLEESLSKESPLSASAKAELKRYQQILGLREQDIEPIRAHILRQPGQQNTPTNGNLSENRPINNAPVANSPKAHLFSPPAPQEQAAADLEHKSFSAAPEGTTAPKTTPEAHPLQMPASSANANSNPLTPLKKTASVPPGAPPKTLLVTPLSSTITQPRPSQPRQKSPTLLVWILLGVIGFGLAAGMVIKLLAYM